MTKITITDIAKQCGVSIKTVSRVLNDSENVSEATRNKVLAAIKESGYQVNLFARGLKGTKTNIIIVFIDRHQEEHLSLWHNLILKHLFYYAKLHNLKIIFSPSNSDKYLEDETDGFYLLSSGVADGAILLETVDQDKRVEYLKKNDIPYVILGEPNDKTIFSVSLDNYDVGHKGGLYLYNRGYRNIHFFVGEGKFLSNTLRIQGFEDALESKNLNYKIYTSIDTVEKAYEKAKKVIEDEKVDVFFVSGDERAVGVYRAIYEMGYQIPKDIAVLGIDNLPLGQFMYPPMSTVHQDFEALARELLVKLVRLMDEKNEEEKRFTDYTKRIPAVILEREST